MTSVLSLTDISEEKCIKSKFNSFIFIFHREVSYFVRFNDKINFRREFFF